jgi:hypothetical protein
MNAYHGWLRFRLRTMLLVVTACACWLGHEVHWVRLRAETLAPVFAAMNSDSCTTGTHIGIPRLDLKAIQAFPSWRLRLGDCPIPTLVVPWREGDAHWDKIRYLFPESELVYMPSAEEDETP